MKRWYYKHLATPLYRIYAWLMPVYVPLDAGMDINPWTLGRRPFFIVWPVSWYRSLRIEMLRRELRKNKKTNDLR